jgi:predicted nucleic acid-binding protein
VKLVVDASAALRQLLSRRSPRLLVHPDLDLLATQHVVEEIERNFGRRVEAMLTQGQLTEGEGRTLVDVAADVLTASLTVVPASFYSDQETEARARVEPHCRGRDWPSVALTLLMGADADGIWTEDRDYWGCGCPVWSTDVLQRVLPMDMGTVA